MAAYTQNRRKQLVVNRPMQTKLILNMALVPAIAMAAIAVFTALYCTNVMDEVMAAEADLPNLTPLFYSVVAFELLTGVFLLFNSLKVSHKVAGPAYRICKSLERIRSGDLSFTVELRRHDHLFEIRDEMNKLIDWLNENPPPGCVTRLMQAERRLEQQKKEEAEIAARAAQGIAQGGTTEGTAANADRPETAGTRGPGA